MISNLPNNRDCCYGCQVEHRDSISVNRTNRPCRKIKNKVDDGYLRCFKHIKFCFSFCPFIKKPQGNLKKSTLNVFINNPSGKSKKEHVKRVYQQRKLTRYNRPDNPRLIAAPNSETGSQPKNKNNPSDDRQIRDAHNNLDFQSFATLNNA